MICLTHDLASGICRIMMTSNFLKRSQRAVWMLMPLLLGAGCLHYRVDPSSRLPRALPESLAVGHAHSLSNAPGELQWQDDALPKYRFARVKLPAPVVAATTNKILELEYYLPGTT